MRVRIDHPRVRARPPRRRDPRARPASVQVVRAIAPAQLERDGMELADVDFVRKQRTELGALHRIVCGLAFAGCVRLAHQQNDASPLDLRELFGGSSLLDETIDGKTERRRWCGTGGFVIHDQSAAGEAAAIKTRLFDRLRAMVETLTTLYTTKHGAAAAAAALPDAAKVRVGQLAGATYGTDNASAATAGARVISELVRVDVREAHGAEEFDALDEETQDRLCKMYCFTCMRHLCNTFLDGGVAAEKTWLEPLLASTIAASPGVLRLSADVNKLFHALAKGLGEGIGLYGRGEGTHFRSWLGKNAPRVLYLALLRFDKGARMDGTTEAAFVVYFNRALIVRYLQTSLYSTSNLLRDNLYVTLSCSEIIATLRGRAAMHDKARRSVVASSVACRDKTCAARFAARLATFVTSDDLFWRLALGARNGINSVLVRRNVGVLVWRALELMRARARSRRMRTDVGSLVLFVMIACDPETACRAPGGHSPALFLGLEEARRMERPRYVARARFAPQGAQRDHRQPVAAARRRIRHVRAAPRDGA